MVIYNDLTRIGHGILSSSIILLLLLWIVVAVVFRRYRLSLVIVTDFGLLGDHIGWKMMKLVVLLAR